MIHDWHWLYMTCDNPKCYFHPVIHTRLIENIKEVARNKGWLISGDKTYCCKQCQKEAEGNG